MDDCGKFIQREIRRGRKYDGVIMDPPSYGRGPSGEIWKMEKDFYPFLLTVREILSENPLFVIINSYTTGLAPSAVGYMADAVFGARFGGAPSAESWACRLPLLVSRCPAVRRAVGSLAGKGF